MSELTESALVQKQMKPAAVSSKTRVCVIYKECAWSPTDVCDYLQVAFQQYTWDIDWYFIAKHQEGDGSWSVYAAFHFTKPTKVQIAGLVLREIAAFKVTRAYTAELIAPESFDWVGVVGTSAGDEGVLKTNVDLKALIHAMTPSRRGPLKRKLPDDNGDNDASYAVALAWAMQPSVSMEEATSKLLTDFALKFTNAAGVNTLESIRKVKEMCKHNN